MAESWIIIAPATGRIVGELYDRCNVYKLERAGYTVKTALQHLQDFNAKLTKPRDSGSVDGQIEE